MNFQHRLNFPNENFINKSNVSQKIMLGYSKVKETMKA